MGVAKYTKDEKDRITDVTLQSGIHVKACYGPEDLERIGFSYEKDLAPPGQYPSRAGSIPRVSGAGHGRRGSIPASARPRNPMSGSSS